VVHSCYEEEEASQDDCDPKDLIHFDLIYHSGEKLKQYLSGACNDIEE
jgi:hypothetical protein